MQAGYKQTVFSSPFFFSLFGKVLTRDWATETERQVSEQELVPGVFKAQVLLCVHAEGDSSLSPCLRESVPGRGVRL